MISLPAGNHQYSFVYGILFGSVIGGTLTWHLSKLSIKPDPDPVDAEQLSATDGKDFVQAGRYLLNWLVNYRSNTVSKLPVISRVEANYLVKALPTEAPVATQSWSSIFSDIDNFIVPGLTNWESSSKFFAYFKPHSSYPAILGELMCAGLNVMGFDWIASPACTELEVVVLDWLAKFLRLPEKFLNLSPGPGGSVIQGSAGEAAIVAFLAALTRTRQAYSRDGKAIPNRENMTVVCSDQAHAIIQKACMVLGIGHHRVVKTKAEHHYALDALDVQIALEEEVAVGRIPIVVVATTGTTSSCAFDPIPAIAEVAGMFNCWVHIDAAYGGAYACLPQLHALFAGLEQVDSFVVNCHKKLLCPFDLSAMYVADRQPVLTALSLQPEYLRNAASDSGAVVDYEHWQLPLGRRFRALKLWFVFRRFGTTEMRRHLQQGIDLSAYFASLLAEHPALFELVVPVSLSLVCFRLKGRSEEDQKKLLDAVKSTGDCFIIHTKLDDRVALRFACGGLEQSMQDVAQGFSVILAQAKKM